MPTHHISSNADPNPSSVRRILNTPNCIRGLYCTPPLAWTMRSIQSRPSQYRRWYVIEQFCDWLSRTSLSVAFQSANWFVPVVQTVHIMAIAILLTSVYVVSFRLIGLTRGAQPLAALTAKSTPWFWTTLGVLLLSGILLTVTEPARELLNWAFRVKMLMVLALAVILWRVQLGMRRN